MERGDRVHEQCGERLTCQVASPTAIIAERPAKMYVAAFCNMMNCFLYRGLRQASRDSAAMGPAVAGGYSMQHS